MKRDSLYSRMITSEVALLDKDTICRFEVPAKPVYDFFQDFAHNFDQRYGPVVVDLFFFWFRNGDYSYILSLVWENSL